MYFALKNVDLIFPGNWISERDILHSAAWSHKFSVSKFHRKCLMDMMSPLYVSYVKCYGRKTYDAESF
jgi:hypothetical protein